MPTVFLAPVPMQQFFDANGDPLSGGLIYTYVTGTTTNQATYTSAVGDVAQTNPIVLNSRGEPPSPIFIITSANYKWVLKTAADVTIWTVDAFGWANPTFEDATVTDDLTVGGDLTVTGVVTASGGISVGQWLCFDITGESTTLTTGTAKRTFRLPACTILAVRASLTGASSSGLPTFDINDDGTSILGANKLSIDANEETSTTATTATTIANPTVADDSEMTIDCDVAGTSATGAKVYIQVLYAAA